MPRRTRPSKPRKANSNIGNMPTKKIGNSGSKIHVSDCLRIGRPIETASDNLTNFSPCPCAEARCNGCMADRRQPVAIPERISSISLRPFLVSTCQKPLHASEPCATAVDRADLVAEHDGAVGADQRAMAFFGIDQFCAGRNHALKK